MLPEYIGCGEDMAHKSKKRAEFGDFQTPLELAQKVCTLLHRQGIRPASVLEPTCGRGAFLRAALEAFPDVQVAVGVELNHAYLECARTLIRESGSRAEIDLFQGDFFTMDWGKLLYRLPEPLLIIGNPPWVTNAGLGSLDSANLPRKVNVDNLRGIEALTGKSNFDISEWMLRRNLEWLDGRTGMLAVLCKTTVARKVLYHAWRRQAQLAASTLYRIDAPAYFGASVDACLLVVRTTQGFSSFDCSDYASLDSEKPTSVFGLHGPHLVSNLHVYEQWAHLEAKDLTGWRSGIKHDCSAVFELRREGQKYRNRLGELVELESEVLFPMLKSSELAGDGVSHSTRWMLVPQRSIGEDNKHLRMSAPRVWRYLEAHAVLLDRRRSTIYKGSPRFAIFGIGEYTFAPWKVAISGLYKKFSFKTIGPYENRPIVFDDTCYFLPCKSEEEAREITSLLNSEVAREFFSAFVFWDAKRPITAQLLNRLDLVKLAYALKGNTAILASIANKQRNKDDASSQQMSLFPDSHPSRL